MTNQPPSPHELEVSVFGPDIGECIVVHLGDGDWMVVDSCKDRETRSAVALDYLGALNVDIASQVRLVVATHWHDDHIDGLGEVLEAAQAARFVNSAVHEIRDLMRLTVQGSKFPLTSATKTYDQIIRILKDRTNSGQERTRSNSPATAVADQRLWLTGDTTRTVQSEVWSLSPSAGTFALAKAELIAAIQAVSGNRRPIFRTANQTCIALWIRVGVVHVLLGADLENSKYDDEGWNAVVGSKARPQEMASFFKIPHHGSANAHSERCWTEMVRSDAVAVVTPYASSSLPTDKDRTRIVSLGRQAFITIDPKSFGSVKRPHVVAKTLGAIKLRRVTGKMGHVRYRIDARDGGAQCQISRENGAQEL